MAYTQEEFRSDLFHAMLSRPDTRGNLSGRALGNSANRAMWTLDKVRSLFCGIRAAHELFFRRVVPDLREYARAIVCTCMQESTGDFRLNLPRPAEVPFFRDHRSYGVIQVTPASVLADYAAFGMAIQDARSGMSVSPRGPFDLSDPFTNVVVHAWYTTNSVAVGTSLREHAYREVWHIRPGNVRRDFGNCLFTWLAGPHNDRHDPADSAAFDDYRKRIGDYWVKAGFGTRARFDELLDSPMLFTMQRGVHQVPTGCTDVDAFLSTVVHMNNRGSALVAVGN